MCNISNNHLLQKIGFGHINKHEGGCYDQKDSSFQKKVIYVEVNKGKCLELFILCSIHCKNLVSC